MNNLSINPKSLRIPTKSYSQGVLTKDNLLFITGQLPQDINGNIIHIGDTKKQTIVIFDRIKEILAEANMNFDDVVKLGIFIKDIKDAKIVSNIRDSIFLRSKPASTLIEVSNFVKEGCTIEIEAIASK